VPAAEFAGGAVRRPGKTGRQLAYREPIWQYRSRQTAGNLHAYQILRNFRLSGR
jgi:hypothetical protein